ncbi:transmembrane protein [Ceratobasidium sp. AG-Ba]|nr:transmembrane protein [Ceratobasidium sp. AG-Ba]
MGWAFGFPKMVQEGAGARCEVLDDGGGYSFPYTMTVLKKVLGQPPEQVGLVYTNEFVFYWDCNQPAGTVLEFRLVSKSSINVASSGNITVRPGAEASASIISVQSIAVVDVSFDWGRVNSQTIQTGSSGAIQSSALASATSGVGTETLKGVPVSVVVGVSIAGFVLLVAIIFLIWRMRRLRQDRHAREPVFLDESPITPFMHHQPDQHTPPIGYVSSYASPQEEPPEYAPPSQTPSSWCPSTSTGYPSTTYPSTSSPSEGRQTGDMPMRDHNFVPSGYEKRRR